MVDFFGGGRGVRGGWCLAKKSPDFRSPEVGISASYAGYHLRSPLTSMTSVHSDIFDVWVCNPPDPFSFFYSFDLFQSAWLVLAGMATPDGGDSDLPNEVCDITNCVTTYYEKDVRASSDFKESEDAKSFERNYRVCLRAIS